jgi:hypothetical protein
MPSLLVLLLSWPCPPKPKPLNPAACLQAELVEAGLGRSQWFVTGEVDPRLFSDSFAFKDESVATTGIKAYATGQRMRNLARVKQRRTQQLLVTSFCASCPLASPLLDVVSAGSTAHCAGSKFACNLCALDPRTQVDALSTVHQHPPCSALTLLSTPHPHHPHIGPAACCMQACASCLTRPPARWSSSA